MVPPAAMRKVFAAVGVSCCVLLASTCSTDAQSVFLSELHYDNSGADEGEAVEVCGSAGTSLEGWTIPLYNGKGGTVYDTIRLSGTIPDQSNGFGALAFFRKEIQNGPDGIALVDANDRVLQFVSYQGAFKATDGPAEDTTSSDIGVTESKTTATGLSLQLVGSGDLYTDFEWISNAPQSFGQINAGMSFAGECDADGGGGQGCVAPPPTDERESPTEDGGDEPGSPETPVVVVTSPGGPCEQSAVKIGSVQGTGTSSPLSEQVVTVRGTVTAAFPRLSGFFVQDAGDGLPATPDGVFVYQASQPTVSVGDEVAVSGTATDSFENTQITVASPAEDIEVCSTGNELPTAFALTLPTEASTLESLEGMLVSLQNPVVTDNYNAGTYGEITVAAERLWQFTQLNKPGSRPAVPKGTTVIVDDGATGRFPNPDTYVDQASVIRVGQTLNNIEGIMAESFGAYRLQPTSALSVASPTNPRPVGIPPGSGNVRVASFNVLNYFTTLNARGAKTVQQREDQLAKITTGALALNADVIGIVEVENDYANSTPSIQVIVDSINAQDEGADWRYVVPSQIPLGSDDIAVGIIYDAAKIALKGSSDALDYNDSKTRASLAQTFAVKCAEDVDQCPAFTLIANHFKSKGSDCVSIGDPDTGDGQGNCNLTRTAAMRSLLSWLNGSSIGVSKDDDILLLGDFNSYAMEDPIQTAASGGFVDLSTSDPAFPKVSSYVFQSESGTLDYILASASAADQRVGEVVHYHVNADETGALEYDNCGTNAACTVSLDQYRCSDHDMAVQDFNLV